MTWSLPKHETRRANDMAVNRYIRIPGKRAMAWANAVELLPVDETQNVRTPHS